jgi:hypothetical protein
MAVATERQLLNRVQSLITERIRSGQAFSTAPADIKDLLDQAGVTPRNPQYAQAVFRTNVRDAQIQAAQEELADPDMLDAFPVWEYIHATGNPSEKNARPEHARRHRLLYPSSVPFVQVRGTDAANVINCRCNFRLIDKFTWNKMKAAGRRIADGYQDVPSIDELRQQRQTTPVRPERQEPSEPQFPTRAELPARPMPAVAQVTQPLTPAAALRVVGDRVAELSYQELHDLTQRLVGQLPAADAVAVARELGLRSPRNRREAVEEITRMLQHRKESIDRTAGIGAGPAPPAGTVPPTSPQNVPLAPFTGGSRVVVTVGQDSVRVAPFDAGVQPFEITPGEDFNGWTYGELRALGNGTHFLRRRADRPAVAEPVEQLPSPALSPSQAAAELARVSANFRDIGVEEIPPTVTRLLGQLSAQDVLAAVREYGISRAKSKAEAIRLVIADIRDRKAAFARVQDSPFI